MANAKLGSKAVGSIVKLKVNGTAKEFIVVHQGKPGSMYDYSCNGTWLLMKDIYENRVWQSGDINKYESSDIHAYLNSTFLNLFDSNIKDAIKTAWWLRSPSTYSANYVLVVNSDGGYNDDYASNSSGIRPALMLPQDMEVDSSGNVTPPPPPATHKTLVNGTAYTVRGGKCMVNGTAYTVRGGKCMVNGTVYNILKGRTLIDGTGYDITFKPSYDPVFANNTWEQIIAACHNNEVPDTWKVADQKPMTIGGVDYQIDIIGKNHDDYSDGSGKAPLTFQLHDCYNIAKAMHSTDENRMGWEKCSMRVEHLPTILKQMPADVQSGIREVNKITAGGGRITVLVTTQDSLFLLSEVEVFGSSSNSLLGEGTQYDYYKAGNSTVKNFNGSAYDWWERSPSISTRYYCVVKSTGSSITANSNTIRGVAFAFCF